MPALPPRRVAALQFQPAALAANARNLALHPGARMPGLHCRTALGTSSGTTVSLYIKRQKHYKVIEDFNRVCS